DLRRAVEDVRGGLLAEAVELVCDRLAVDALCDRLTNLDIREDGMRGVLMRSLTVDFGIRVGKVDAQLLGGYTRELEDLAGPISLANHTEQDFRLDLQVPGIVVIACLKDRPRRRGRITAALEDDAAEIGLVWLPVVFVDDVDHLIVRGEGFDDIRPGSDRVGHERVVSVTANLENVLRIDEAGTGAGKGIGPKRVGTIEIDPDGELVEDLRSGDRFEDS